MLPAPSSAPRFLLPAAWLTTLLGAFVTLFILRRATDDAGSPGVVVTLWALTPFAALCFATAFCPTRGRAGAALGCALVVSAFGAIAYADALFVHPSSTSGLIFLFLPAVELALVVVLLTTLLLLPSPAAE